MATVSAPICSFANSAVCPRVIYFASKTAAREKQKTAQGSALKKKKNAMITTREQAYLAVCKELNERPLQQLREALELAVTGLDVSNIYVPRRHLRCVLRLVEERPEIDSLVLDGTSIGADEARLLKEFLPRSCVSMLSLQRIKLDAVSTAIIRQLCIEHPSLVSINLKDTCIPAAVADEILLIVDLNRLNAASLRSMGTEGARHEACAAPRPPLCRQRENQSLSTGPSISSAETRRLVDDFVASYENLFADPTFPPQAFDHPVSGIETIRWGDYSTYRRARSTERGGVWAGFQPSALYSNHSLCATLNVLRFYDVLSRSLLLKGYPEAGLYVFRLFIGGQPVEVCVDDLIPCKYVDGDCKVVGLDVCSAPFHAAVLEKAVAKVMHGYRNAEQLSLRDCIELLTGSTCFEIDLVGQSMPSYDAFDSLRNLLDLGHKLAACVIPRTLIERQTLEDSGVCCGIPYAVLKTDVCFKNGAHYAYLIQVAAPSCGKVLKYAFEYGPYHTEEVNGNCVSWMTLEDFAVTFEMAFLILWPFDEALSDHKRTADFFVTTESSSASSQFARNPTFAIQNKGNGSSGVMVSVIAANSSRVEGGAKCLFYKSAGGESADDVRRYDICEANALFESAVFNESEGSVFFSLRPKERLQMTLSSRAATGFTVRISSVESVRAVQLPDAMPSLTFSSSWTTAFHSKRFSDDIFCLRSASGKRLTRVVLALSQTTDDRPPFPIGVLGWKGSSSDVVEVEKPHFATQQERSVVCVHSIVLSLTGGENFFLLPYCCGGQCPNGFKLTVFSDTKLTQRRVNSRTVLQCT